jgi:hypothetical protein
MPPMIRQSVWVLGVGQDEIPVLFGRTLARSPCAAERLLVPQGGPDVAVHLWVQVAAENRPLSFGVILSARVSTNNSSPARLHKFRRRPSVLPSRAPASRR